MSVSLFVPWYQCQGTIVSIIALLPAPSQMTAAVIWQSLIQFLYVTYIGEWHDISIIASTTVFLVCMEYFIACINIAVLALLMMSS